MASVNRPEILLLSLVCQPWFDESYSALIDKLHESAKLKRVKTADAAIRYLEGNNPRTVLEKIFIPVPDAQSQSHVFAPAFVDQTQAAVVGATVGDGYLAYIGDVNAEAESNRVLISLCGL
ncbi:transcription factor Rba50 protein [Rutstroemia sp. NJR-2017a BBW]|nr:transcription factor Rba50 protein [Rutstroemia sp. NJR-2017a BBW]